MADRRRAYGTGSISREGDGWRVQLLVRDLMTGETRLVRRCAKTRAAARVILQELQHGAPAPVATAACAR